MLYAYPPSPPFMSGLPDTQIRKFDDREDDDDDDDQGGGEEEEYEVGGPHPEQQQQRKNKKQQQKQKQRQKKTSSSSSSSTSTSKLLRNKAKQVVLFPFTKSKQKIPTKPSNDINNNAASPSGCCGFSGKKKKNKKKKRVAVPGSCFCFSGRPPPSSLGSPAESTTSDPNDPHFTFDMLKALIETNDFYSRECNTHLLDTSSP